MSEGRSEDDSRRREADAILKRVRQETEPQAGGHAEAWFTRARAHFSAADADQGDRVEVIGSRIGRIAGLIAFFVLLVLFILQFAA